MVSSQILYWAYGKVINTLTERSVIFILIPLVLTGVQEKEADTFTPQHSKQIN